MQGATPAVSAVGHVVVFFLPTFMALNWKIDPTVKHAPILKMCNILLLEMRGKMSFGDFSGEGVRELLWLWKALLSDTCVLGREVPLICRRHRQPVQIAAVARARRRLSCLTLKHRSRRLRPRPNEAAAVVDDDHCADNSRHVRSPRMFAFPPPR